MPFPPRRGPGPAEEGGRTLALEDARGVETVGDLDGPDRLARELPRGSRGVADFAPFVDEPLMEVLRAGENPRDPELFTGPVDATAPGGPVVPDDRRPGRRRDPVGPSDSREAAVRAATNWIHRWRVRRRPHRRRPGGPPGGTTRESLPEFAGTPV